MGEGRSKNRVALVAGVACTGEVGEAEDAVGDLTLGLYLDCKYSSVVERGDEGGSVGVGGIDIRMVRHFEIQGQQFTTALFLTMMRCKLGIRLNPVRIPILTFRLWVFSYK